MDEKSTTLPASGSSLPSFVLVRIVSSSGPTEKKLKLSLVEDNEALLQLKSPAGQAATLHAWYQPGPLVSKVTAGEETTGRHDSL